MTSSENQKLVLGHTETLFRQLRMSRRCNVLFGNIFHLNMLVEKSQSVYLIDELCKTSKL